MEDDPVTLADEIATVEMVMLQLEGEARGLVGGQANRTRYDAAVMRAGLARLREIEAGMGEMPDE